MGSDYETTSRPRGKNGREKILTLGADAPPPPHDLRAEAGVLGSMMLDPKAIATALLFVQASDFFDPRHQSLFDILKDMWTKQVAIDGTTLTAAINAQHKMADVGGMDYLQEVANNVPTSDNAEYYAAIVKENARKRAVLQAAMKTIDDVQSAIDTASDLHTRALGRFYKIEQAGTAATVETLHEAATTALQRINDSKTRRGILTQYYKLDDMTGGLNPGENIVIAARPSVGKTALAINILCHAAFAGESVAMFSLEMSNEELALRVACAMSGIPMIQVRRNLLDDAKKSRLATAIDDFRGMGFHLVNNLENWNISSIRAAAQRLVHDKGVKLLAIDYLQLMSGDGDSRQEQIAGLSREVKKMARALNVPVLCLSQLNRDSDREMRRPRLSDLRESGAIEQDADTVWMLHREAVLHRSDPEWLEQNQEKANEAFLIVAKQRNGAVGDIRLGFDEQATWFVNEDESISRRLLMPSGQAASEKSCPNCGKGGRFDASFCWNCGLTWKGPNT
jgi:replicative DNA helicase